MFARKLSPPSTSFFLLGPRATGKSTWIQSHFSNAQCYDLLSSREYLRFTRAPETLFRETSILPPGSWVVIDEIQKVPSLLDEVHRLIEQHQLRFVLSGSSARKLRRGGFNLLAGRAIMKNLYPLTSAEMDFNLDLSTVLRFGTLPLSITGNDPESYLEAYVDVYLQEEIRAEALTRNIGGFSRFLEIAARQNSQITNMTSISRDAAVSRQTVTNYFDLLSDTLIGYWLTPWKLKRSTRQVAHPKFYLFDCGVARMLSGRLPYPPTAEEEGALFETFILNEVRAYFSYSNIRYPLHFWRSHDGVEVDLLCETKTGFVAIEIKAAERWDKRYNRGLTRIRAEFSPASTMCYGIYRGARSALWDDVSILPAMDFLEKLWSGDVFQ